MRYLFIKSVLFFLTFIETFGTDIPKNYFASPVDYPISLSGNFGELRNAHFHSGIDIRTFGNGKKTYAAAEGFVSRIKISAWGYGNALYIDHPNGYTTVYAHLDRFHPKLDAYIKSLQYEQKTFEIDVKIRSKKFSFKKGDFIAISGNSGFSSGPHLHFEIRETLSEHPVNPLLFDFTISDSIPPKIFNLYIYPLDNNSSVNGRNQRKRFSVAFNKDTYYLTGNPKINLHGRIGFGVEINDYLNGTKSRCGIYSLCLKIDEKQVFKFEFPKFSFDETRYINSHMDYELKKMKKKHVHKTFVAPNNYLSIYKDIFNRGVTQFTDDSLHTIELIASDVTQNISHLKFVVRSSSVNFKAPVQNYTQIMPYEQENYFQNDSIKLFLPDSVLYDTLYFQYKKERNPGSFCSSIYQIQKHTYPVHKHCSLSIRPKNLPKHLYDKALIVFIDEKEETHGKGGEYLNGWVETQIRNFGKFAVAVDTLPPVITPLRKYKGANLSNLKSIKFKITDDLSGIKNYEGTIDDNWVLFEYDAKNDLIIYRFDSSRLKDNSRHTLNIIVTDEKDNKSQYRTHFTW